MKRVIGMIAALVLLCCGAEQARADLVFSFSITNTIGDVSGTVTGEIFGLSDNATSSATSVLIESFPAGLDSLVNAPIDATLWDQQYQNSFTVSNGQIVGGGFWAEQTINSYSYGYQLYINGDTPYGFNFLNLDGTDQLFVWGDDGLANANLQPESASATPEPSSLALLAGGIACVGGYVRRGRKQPA